MLFLSEFVLLLSNKNLKINDIGRNVTLTIM